MGKKRKPTTEELLHGYVEPFSGRDLAKEIIFCVISMGFVTMWVLVMLLILSFVSLSYFHFNIKWMIICSVLCGIATGILYVVSSVRKYKRIAERNKTR